MPIAEPAVRVHVCHHQPGAAASGDYPSPAIADDVLLAITHALGEEDRVGRIGSGRRIDSRDIVRKCVDYANSVDRIPSISELCLAAHVSERRLRKAFTDEFDLPPSQYFRAWALDVAHTRLATEGSSGAGALSPIDTTKTVGVNVVIGRGNTVGTRQPQTAGISGEGGPIAGLLSCS